MSGINVLSLFDGISAAKVALNNLGIKINNYHSSEIDKYAIQVSKNNHPDIIQIGNVKGIVIENDYIFYNQDNDPMKNGGSFKSNVDLLIGGSPCQSFSIAGNQKGFEDPRGQLFFEYVRILKEVKPKFFILENVSSMKKEAKNEMTNYLFGIEPITINSSLLTAQQRKRIYFVGALQEDGTYKKVEIEQPQDKGILLKDILESGNSFNEKSYCIDASYYKGSNLENTLNKHKRTLIAEPICVASRGRNIINGKRQDIKGAKTEQRLEPNFTFKTNCLTTVSKDNLILEPVRLGHFNKGGQADRIYSVLGKSICLGANGGGGGANTGLYKIDLPDGDYVVRKLTPNECARLQGFNDFYHNGISNTQAYKCYGNSFTVPVIEHLLKHIFN